MLTVPSSSGRLTTSWAVALLVLCAPPPTRAATPLQEPRAVSILDSALAASGGRSWAAVRGVRYAADVQSGAARGSAETLEDSRTGRFVDRYVMGQVRGGQGFDGTQAWTSDVTGRTVSLGAAEGDAAAVSDVYRRSLAYWFRDRHPASLRYLGRRPDRGGSFEVIGIVPEGGRPFELWIGVADHRIARLVDDASGARRTTAFADFRRVRGLLFPFSARTTGTAPGEDTIVTFTRIEIDPPLAADAFTPPFDAAATAPEPAVSR